MNSCSSSEYASDVSEGGRRFVFKVRASSAFDKAKPEKLGGYGSLSPDGAESSTDDEDARPSVRAQSERLPLLNAETAHRAQAATATSVLSVRSSGLSAASAPPNQPSAALTQVPINSPTNHHETRRPPDTLHRGTTKKNALSDSSVSSSLVATSSDDDHPLPLVKKTLPQDRRPDWDRPIGHHSSDGVHQLIYNGSPSVLPEKSHNAHGGLPNTPPQRKKGKQVVQPASSSVVKPKLGLREADIVRKYAVEAPFKRITAKGPAQHGKRPATLRELRQIKLMMRERALNKYEVKPGVNRFELLFTDKRYAHIDDASKIKGLFGDITPISSKTTSDEEQDAYYAEVVRLYLLNTEKKGEVQIAKTNFETNRKKSEEEKDECRFDALKEFLWELTPNQRHGLREKFHSLYGNSVLRDDTDWMFFDTIIRSYTLNDEEQRKLMNDISSATKNRLPIIDKLCNKLAGLSTRKISSLAELRLHKRDELCSKIQGLFTQKQRDEIKRVCKERHNSFLYSRLPLLQVIILEKNQQALEDYENTVLRFIHANHFFELFNCRSRTLDKNPGFNGDGAFFTMAQLGSIDMMLHFLTFILTNVTLCGSEKVHILQSYRHSDNATAFHMIMAAGDYDRAKAVLMHFNYLGQQLENVWGTPKVKFNDTEVSTFVYSESIALIMGEVFSSKMNDPSRRDRYINGYTRAIDHGHMRCARMFRKRLRYNWLLHVDVLREYATAYYKACFKPNGDPFEKDVLKAAKEKEKREENVKNNGLKLFRTKMKEKKQRTNFTKRHC
nr:hypothetical protein [uncultured Noviherbaspirillum sp.]